MYVYFIRSGRRKNNAIKIGKAMNIQRRLDQLQTGNPCQLHLLGYIRCDSVKHAEHIEKLLHDRFKKQNIRGEWFAGNIHYKKYLNE